MHKPQVSTLHSEMCFIVRLSILTGTDAAAASECSISLGPSP
jgi:hypothetical protein